MKDFGLKKLYYSISEVSKLSGLEQYILRYWETEFEQLKPGKNRAGNRIYTNKDIKLIIYIKKLLREEKYTIEGAKKILEDYSSQSDIPSSKDLFEKIEVPPEIEHERNLKKDLEEIKKILISFRNYL
ncbi:MAG: MerR family transcriptional regulator [Melioribacteraceae bacterium]|nr:MerR family transcriptional regulator [Melioribacteraceae bacterium]